MAGVITGMLAGLFGVGGGAVIVPVLFEVFRLLGVPEEVRMQLCVGTSMAIIVPTARRPAYLIAAANLADELGCILVTLHSKQWTNATKAAQRSQQLGWCRERR